MINFQTFEFETSFGNSAQLFFSDRPEVVFTGRSNVGKSSLINRLCNKKSMARTSSVPGKTETINFYVCPALRLVDLPGYGYAKRAKSRRDDWGDLMNHYFTSGRNIRFAVALADIRHAPSPEDMLMFEYLEAYDINFVIAATKSDKLKKAELADYEAAFPEHYRTRLLPVSAVSGVGIEELKKHIQTAVETV